ncbi:MAG: choice-of-anchor D domain-containing protein, partial [bacterium]|nr:choice-of-anchor D domain-containing protein [bacterium]
MEAYRWDSTWHNVLTRDASYGSGGRMCGADPLSIRVTDVMTFSPFVLRGLMAPEITVLPTSLLFGDQDVDAGVTVSQTVTITNDGTADLHISMVTPTGDTGEFNLVDSGEATLTPGSTRAIEVSFDPSSVGARTVTLTIQSDDTDESTVDVALNGTGIDQEITVLPSSLLFGAQDVDAGPTVSQTVTITNDGTADLHISAVSPTGDTSEFNLVDSGIAGNGAITLTSGGTRTIEVSFDPSGVGAKAVTLTIQSDDTDESTVDVALNGTGIDQEITVLPSSLLFGAQDVDAGPTVSQTVTITNDGSTDLHISAISPTGDTSEFNLVDSGIAGNGAITLTPGSTR